MNITAIQISEKRQKVKTSDESIKMRKFISMTATMLKIGFIGFGGGSALIPVIEEEVVEKDKIVSEEEFNRIKLNLLKNANKIVGTVPTAQKTIAISQNESLEIEESTEEA